MSWQARVSTLLVRWGVRPVVELVPDTVSVARTARRLLCVFTDLCCRPHPEATIVRVAAPAPDGIEVRGEWVLPPGTPPPETVGGIGDGVPGGGVPDLRGGAVFYIHGSGYTVASARTHRAITSRLAVWTGRPVFACDYRLAPVHRFPAAADDVDAAFTWLIDHGARPDQVVIAGDSAGVQLGLALAAEYTARTQSPAVAALLFFSPLVDLSLARVREWESGRRRDPLVSAARVERLLRVYLDGAEMTSPRLRFTSEGLRGLPPMQIHVSDAEFLYADTRHLVEMIEAADGQTELQLWPGQLHVFQALPGFVPEATHSLRAAATFAHHHLERARPTDNRPVTDDPA